MLSQCCVMCKGLVSIGHQALYATQHSTLTLTLNFGARSEQRRHLLLYFPGNYRWSSAFINMMGSAGKAGPTSASCTRSAAVEGKGPKTTTLVRRVREVADGVRAHAKVRNGGHRVSAAAAYLRACKLQQMAERFRTPR